jgi:hypothetical protein
MTPEEINKLPTQNERYNARIDSALYDHYDSNDTLNALYKAFNRLPACPLLGVIGNAIQELQYYKQGTQHGN